MNTAALLTGAAGGVLAGAGAWVVLAAAFSHTAAPARRARRLPADRNRALRAAGAAGAAVLVWGLTSWPVAAVLAAAGTWWLPRLLGPDRTHAERLARIEAVAAWTEQVRDLMAAASGLQGAIASTAPIAPVPIRGQVAALAERIRTNPQEALERFAAEVDVPTADLVATALGSAAERHAADLGSLLTNLAEAARDQAAMLVRTAAGRARVRTAMRIITATTLALAALLMLFNPTYLVPFDSAAGQAVLAVIGVLWAAALAWLSRLARTDLGPRVLRPRTQEQEVGA